MKKSLGLTWTLVGKETLELLLEEPPDTGTGTGADWVWDAESVSVFLPPKRPKMEKDDTPTALAINVTAFLFIVGGMVEDVSSSWWLVKIYRPSESS